MSIGNIVGDYARQAVATASTTVRSFASTVNQMSGEAFTDPRKVLNELVSGVEYLAAEKAYELASSSAVILGSTVFGIAAAKKVYSLKQGHGEHNALFIARRIGFAALSLGFIGLAAYETYHIIPQLRLNGRCAAMKGQFPEVSRNAEGGERNTNYWNFKDSYRNQGCEYVTGSLIK
ncbi:MAG: hypothetical protein JSS30_04655 [Verrucomicrobia bacterium]|nr:hypothetical protein [Verrucomicrobiota bacterium]